MDKPNVRLPLAVSYNEREQLGLSKLNDGYDQRKINSYYEPISNAFSGKTTLYLCKRPGIQFDSNATAASVTTYSMVRPLSDTIDAAPWVFSIRTVATSSQVLAYQSAVSSAISTMIGYYPEYAERARVNNVDNIVLQAVSTYRAPQRVFYASSFGTWTQIASTFSTYLHRGKMEHMDGFSFFLEASSRIFNSNLNTISTFPAANFIAKQIRQDIPVGLARLNNQLLAFGRETVEVFYNGGLTPAPLIPIKQLHARIGLSVFSTTGGNGSNYYAVNRNTMYFTGLLSGSIISMGAYAYDGGRFEKISTPAIDKIFTESPPRSVESLFFHGQEAVAFRLDHVSTTPQRWFMFFPRWKDWSEWNSEVFTPINDGQFFLSAGSSTMTFTTVPANSYMDVETHYIETIRFQLPSEGNHNKRMPYFGVIGDTASQATTSRLEIAVTDDNWQTTTAVGTIDMTSRDKIVTRLGSFQERGFIMTHEGNLDLRLTHAVARVEE